MQPGAVLCDHFDDLKAKAISRNKHINTKGDLLHVNINTLVHVQIKPKIISGNISKPPSKVNNRFTRKHYKGSVKI